MTIAVQNGKLARRQSYNDKRKIEYLICFDNGEMEWKSRDFVIELIKKDKIVNAKLSGNNIVKKEDEYYLIRITPDKIPSFMSKVRNLYRKYLEDGGEFVDMIPGFYYLDRLVNETKKEELPQVLKGVVMGTRGKDIDVIFSVERKGKLDWGFPIVNLIVPYNDSIPYMVKLSKQLKNSVFWVQEYNEDYKKYFKYINIKSTYKDVEENEFLEYGLHSGHFLTQYSENLVRDRIEELYFPEINMKDIVIECWEAKRMDKYLQKLRLADGFFFSGFWGLRYKSPVVVGFHYFGNGIFDSSVASKEVKIKYLVALYKGYVIGVIKFGTWYSEQSIAYIDVLCKYQNKGIATRMIKELDKYLDTKMTLYLTMESNKGKEVHIADKFKKYIKSTKILTYEEKMAY